MRAIRNRYFLVSDIVLLPIGVYLSFVLRLDEFALHSFWPAAFLFSGLVISTVPFVFYPFGLYSRYWPYASIEEAPRLIAGVLALTTIVTAISFAPGAFGVQVLPNVPRSVPFIFFFLALAMVVTPRLLTQGLVQSSRSNSSRIKQEPTIVIGAGATGMNVVRELSRNDVHGLRPVAFIDDDPAKLHMRILGIPVLGTRHDIPAIIQKHTVTQAIIVMPSARGSIIREIVDSCERAGIRPKILPAFHELLDGTLTIGKIRDIELEDLLGREPVQTDLGAVKHLVSGKRVLITGAGGSIGSELSRQVLRLQPAELVLLGRGENSVFSIQNELTRNITNQAAGAEHVRTCVHGVIGDVRFADRMETIFERYRPEIVFHAAAHKHVPLMELNPSEAVTNNVLGTRNVLQAARKVGTERFVFVSTDKAVNPASIMGASKRAAELLVHQVAAEDQNAYMIVRFGNVLGSRGSVVLTMKEQIAYGGPVTVTDSEMTRYFMTIPEAVHLMLQAAVLGRGGEVFMFDMGDAVKIDDLAKDLVRLSGLEIHEDIDIVYTGARPGEKLYEDLFLPTEQYDRTNHEKIFIAANASQFVPIGHHDLTNELIAAAERDDDATVRATFSRLVPEYQPCTISGPAVPAATHTAPGRNGVDDHSSTLLPREFDRVRLAGGPGGD